LWVEFYKTKVLRSGESEPKPGCVKWIFTSFGKTNLLCSRVHLKKFMGPSENSGRTFDCNFLHLRHVVRFPAFLFHIFALKRIRSNFYQTNVINSSTCRVTFRVAADQDTPTRAFCINRMSTVFHRHPPKNSSTELHSQRCYGCFYQQISRPTQRC